MARLIILMLLGAALGSGAAAQHGALRDQLLGTWTLAAIYQEQPGGEDIDAFGNNPEGHLMLDRSGWFALQIVGTPRRFASNERGSGTTSEYKFAMQQCVAYFGVYTVDEVRGLLTLHVRRSLFPNWNGTDRQASVTITADRMEFLSASDPSPTGAFYSHMTWVRDE
jgi:Lipocalin-like domain